MLYIILAIVILLIIWVIVSYNKLVKLRNKVKDQWSQIDIQLKKRFDLIPNLVEIVKGYAKYENETLKEVVEARNSAISAKTPTDEVNANNQLTSALNKLFALSEAYPELKADNNFKELQENLREVEDKIAYARQFYSDAVLNYKNAIETFPTIIIAKAFGFKQESFFTIVEDEKQNVKIQF